MTIDTPKSLARTSVHPIKGRGPVVQHKGFERSYMNTFTRPDARSASQPIGLKHGRRAKIVATLGPASSSPEVFRKLVRAGADVARLNFSHGSHPQKTELIAMVRKISQEERKPICILADLQGPKIRTGKLKDHRPVQLIAGEHLTITPRDILGTASVVGTTFKTLAENLEPGSRILLSDGLIELRVDRIDGV